MSAPDRIEELHGDVRYLLSTIRDLQQTVRDLAGKIDKQDDSNYVNLVTQNEFKPIKLIVYGIVGLVLTGVFTSIITLAVGNHK